MKTVLTNIGIDQHDAFIYEYDPIKLDWWNSDYKTSVEIEIHEDEEDSYQVSVIFCPETEGIVERPIVFLATFKSNTLQDQALIEKKIYDHLIGRKMALEWSEAQNAYMTTSYTDAKEVFIAITKLLNNKTPIYKIDLNDMEIEDDDDSDSCELGVTLDHFIAMMSMNSVAFIEDNIVEYIELGIQIEGMEYLTTLKEEVDTQMPQTFKENFDLDDDAWEILKKTIRNYTQQMA